MALFTPNSLGARAVRQLKKKKMVLACFGIIAIYLIVAFLGMLNWLPDYQERIGTGYSAPDFSLAGIFGTDVFGRSVFYKLLAGTKTAMTIGLTVTAIAVPIGVTGALAGYYGGKVDAFVVWLYTVIVSVPYILMVIAISYVLGAGIGAICIAMGMVSWVSLCRLTRGEFIKHREREYVLASRLLGASDALIISSTFSPTRFTSLSSPASLMVLSAIKSEVILTFLGVGIQDGSSWGTMISDASGELVQGIWWPLAWVVTMMFFIIYALNVVGDAMRDALDPKLVD